MTTARPPESRSADSTAVSDEGQAPPLVHEMAPGQRFPSPNQVAMERGPFWRAGLLPESPWEAHPVTIIANLGEPIGESRLKRRSDATQACLAQARARGRACRPAERGAANLNGVQTPRRLASHKLGRAVALARLHEPYSLVVSFAFNRRRSAGARFRGDRRTPGCTPCVTSWSIRVRISRVYRRR